MGRNVGEPSRCKASKSRGKTAASRIKQRTDLECFQPTDWLSLTKPNKTPFYPQMGDDCMYFRQGHQNYADAVKKKNLYEMEPSSLPWTKEIRPIHQQEWVKIIGIDYKIKSLIRVICLKLGIIDPISGFLTRKCFSIEYHDVDDIVDFLVLKQDYDTAIKRPWKSSQKFRSLMNDDRGVQMWWEGEFIKKEPLDAKFPESMFLCCCVRWDNGDHERLSPWDLENIDARRRPNKTGTSVQLLPSDIRSLLYKPNTDDWPPLGDRDFECDRISSEICKVMGLYEAKHFATPVNLESFPGYAFVVKYPIDLSTIKARLDNRFYRRATAVEYDVLRIRTNAREFNDPKSDIVRNSCIITDLCLEIIRNGKIDFTEFFLELIKKYICNKVKKTVGNQLNEKHQIKQSSSFALTFTNRVSGSGKSSIQTSNQKLIFKPSQSSTLVSSNQISVKVSSSFTVDKLNTDVDLTTDCDQSSDSLNQQNRNKSETTNIRRKKKKCIDPVDIEIGRNEQSHKRRKTVSINPHVAINSEDQFSDLAIPECDNVATHLNEDDLLTSILKRKSKSEKNLDSTCTTASSLPGMDNVGSQVDVTAKAAVHSPNDSRIVGIIQDSNIPTSRARINHESHTRIRREKIGTPLMMKRKSRTLYTPFISPMPIAVSTPIKVCQKTSLYQNTFLGEMGKHEEQKFNGWSISFHDYPKGFVDALNGRVLKDKLLETRFSKQSPIFETAEKESCYKSNILNQCSGGKMTSTSLLTQETSTLNDADMTSCPTALSLTDSDTKLERKNDCTRVKSPSTVSNPSNPNNTSPKESESPSSKSIDDYDLIEQILAESKFPVLKQKTRKEKLEKKKNKMSAAPCLLKVSKDCKKSMYRKNDARSKVFPDFSVIPLEGNKKQSVKNQITPTPTNLVDSDSCEMDRFSFTVQEIPSVHQFNVTVASKTISKEKDKFSESTSPNPKFVVPEESELSSSQSTNEVIKQILDAAESKFAIQKQKTTKKENIEISAVPCSKVKEEGMVTHTNVAYSISDEKNRITSSIRKKSKIERQSTVDVSINNTNLKEKEDISFKPIEPNQQSLCPKEKETSSSHSTKALIKQILIESKCATLKQKTCSKSKSKKKKKSLNQHSVFTEEDNSSFSESNDAIIKKILSEAKLSSLKPKISKRKTSSVISCSSRKTKDCQETLNVDGKLGSAENSLNRSRSFHSQRPITFH